MPIRGETIGRAYVRILADGSGFDEDVKRQLRESNDTFQTLGEEHGQAYDDGFKDQQDKNELDKDFEKRLEAGVGRMHAIGEDHGDHFTQGFRDSLKAEFGDLIGDQINKNLEDALQKGSSFQGIADRLENIRPEVARATEQIAADQDRIYAKQNADNEKKYSLYLQDRERLANALNDALAQQNADQEKDWDLHLQRLADMNDAYNENWRRDLDNNERDYQTHIAKLQRADQLREGSAKIHSQSLKDLDAQYKTLINDVNKFGDGSNRSRQSFRDLHDDIDNLASGMAILGATSKDTDKGFEDMRRTLHRFGTQSNDASKKGKNLENMLGKAFGKGARNNFVNAVGSIMGGIGSLGDSLLNLPKKIQGIGDKIGLIFDQAGSTVGGFIAISGKIIPMFGAIGFGAIALTAIVGTLSTALLLAAGAALALASSLAFGVVGALAPLVGLLGPVGVAFGTVALAFLTMSKAQRKATLKPFTDGLKTLGKLALPGIMDGLTKAFDRLRKPQGEGTIKLFQRVEHMATAAGNAVGAFLENFAIGIRGAGLGQFIGTMTDRLPSIMGRLGRILGNTFEGFLGVLSTLNRKGGPVDTLLNSMNKLTKGFGTWSVSPAAIKFFDDARDSASALLDFIEPLAKLLFKIMNAGKGAGDNMFTEMGNSIQKWSDSLSKRDLNNFFKDAQKMGEALGEVVKQIGRLIAALDDPTTRQFAIGLVKAFGSVVEEVANLVGWFAGLDESVQGVATAFTLMLVAWGPLSKALLGSRLGQFASQVKNAETRVSALNGAAKTAATAGGIALLYDGATHAERGISVLEDAAGGAALGFAAGGPFGAALGGAGGMLFGLGNAFFNTGKKAKEAYEKMRKASPVQAAIQNLEDLKGTLDQVTGAYTGATRAAVLDKLQKADTIKIGHKFGLSAREMVNSVLGTGDAFAKLRPVFQDYGNQIDTVKTKQQQMINEAMKAPFGPATAADARKMLLGGFGDPNEAFISLENQKKGLQERRAELAKLPGVLRQDAREIQNNSRITQDLVGKLKSIPPKIRTKIEDSGIIPTTKGVAQIARRYNLLDRRKIKTLISASGADTTVAAVRRVMKRLDDLAKMKPRPSIDVDTKKAESKIKGTLSQLGFVGKFLSQPSVLLDITKFDQKNQDVKNKVAETGKLNPQIKVDAQTQQASANLNAVKTQVDNLPTSHTITVNVNTVRHGKGNAAGGIFSGAQYALIGEAGPEAVVPLNRPLHLVDPAVRELSAIAQGQNTVSATAPGGRSVTTGPITIITPIKDPVAVAQQVVNRIAAASYI